MNLPDPFEKPKPDRRATALELVFWVAFLFFATLLIWSAVGCVLEPIKALADNETEIEASANTVIALKAQVNDLKTEIGTLQTTIGGGVDSIALSLAIVALGVSPFAGAWYYERFRRPKRLSKSERRHHERRERADPNFPEDTCRRKSERRRQ